MNVSATADIKTMFNKFFSFKTYNTLELFLLTENYEPQILCKKPFCSINLCMYSPEYIIILD